MHRTKFDAGHVPDATWCSISSLVGPRPIAGEHAFHISRRTRWPTNLHRDTSRVTAQEGSMLLSSSITQLKCALPIPSRPAVFNRTSRFLALLENAAITSCGSQMGTMAVRLDLGLSVPHPPTRVVRLRPLTPLEEAPLQVPPRVLRGHGHSHQVAARLHVGGHGVRKE